MGFISVASYNNWPDGSQIEEVVPRAGFLDYNPGSKTKYLDLTAHWVGNFLKTRQEASAAGTGTGAGSVQSCYELINNTICWVIISKGNPWEVSLWNPYRRIKLLPYPWAVTSIGLKIEGDNDDVGEVCVYFRSNQLQATKLLSYC